jgi:hypothetical protein
LYQVLKNNLKSNKANTFNKGPKKLKYWIKSNNLIKIIKIIRCNLKLNLRKHKLIYKTNFINLIL